MNTTFTTEKLPDHKFDTDRHNIMHNGNVVGIAQHTSWVELDDNWEKYTGTDTMIECLVCPRTAKLVRWSEPKPEEDLSIVPQDFINHFTEHHAELIK